MAFRFEADESFGKGVRRIALAQIEKATGELAGGGDGDAEEVIHGIRKRLKKIRALIRLSGGGLGRKVARREDARFRDAGRPLSELRDAGVLVLTLDKLAGRSADGAFHPEVVGPAREQLLARRGEITTRLIEEDDILAELAGSLEGARQSVKGWAVVGDDREILGSGLRRIEKRARAAFRDALGAPTDVNLHEWRKRVKDLWYALDLLAPVRPGYAEGRGRLAHRLADLLGDDHDLAVLRDRLSAPSGGAGDLDSAHRLLPTIEDRRAELLREAFAIGPGLHREAPGEVAARFRAYWRAWRAEARAAEFDRSGPPEFA